MKKVITYGTYDHLHWGHIALLERAKKLGDYLIVGVTSDNFDLERGKLNVRYDVMERIESIRSLGIADKIIIEEYTGQKIDDINKYGIDVFAIGSDWEGQFDYLNEFCKVTYLPRSQGISSTDIRCDKTINLGIISTGRIVDKFIPEAEFVNGIKITNVYNPIEEDLEIFKGKYPQFNATSNLDEFLDSVDAVYVASPHIHHFYYSKLCLERGKHVLCETPISLSSSDFMELTSIAENKGLILMEANKTAYCPSFNHLITLLKSGVIGQIVDIEASLSTIRDIHLREFDPHQKGGCVTENLSIAILPILKLLGFNYDAISFTSKMSNDVDIYTYAVIHYPSAVASIKLGLGVKTEGDLVVSGTKGYVYVPAPWWKTDYFEVRYEDINNNKKYFYSYDGEGLRYELKDFVLSIINDVDRNFKLSKEEIHTTTSIIESYLNKENIRTLI